MSNEKTNKFINELRSWVKDEKRTVSGIFRAEFLAAKDDITAALDEGWPILTIYEKLKTDGRITFKYDTLTRLIRSEIRGEKDKNINKEKKSGTNTKAEPKKTENNESFTFNANPNKDELI